MTTLKLTDLPDPNIKIAFLQRGNVIVGRYSEEGMKCCIRGGAVIRRWGTEHGIGQIAAAGPTEETILDPIPTVEWHILTGVMSISCNPDAWYPHIRPTDAFDAIALQNAGEAVGMEPPEDSA